jgi:hypothetical protein
MTGKKATLTVFTFLPESVSSTATVAICICRSSPLYRSAFSIFSAIAVTFPRTTASARATRCEIGLGAICIALAEADIARTLTSVRAIAIVLMRILRGRIIEIDDAGRPPDWADIPPPLARTVAAA